MLNVILRKASLWFQVWEENMLSKCFTDLYPLSSNTWGLIFLMKMISLTRLLCLRFSLALVTVFGCGSNAVTLILIAGIRIFQRDARGRIKVFFFPHVTFLRFIICFGKNTISIHFIFALFDRITISADWLAREIYCTFAFPWSMHVILWHGADYEGWI